MICFACFWLSVFFQPYQAGIKLSLRCFAALSMTLRLGLLVCHDKWQERQKSAATASEPLDKPGKTW